MSGGNIAEKSEEPISTEQKYSSVLEAFTLGSEDTSVNGSFYSFEDGKLVRENGTKSSVISNVKGDNLNASNGKLYYTAFENGEASIRSYDANSGKVSEVLKTGDAEIFKMYVVNDRYIEYLEDGEVSRYDLAANTVEKIEAPKDVFSFIPTGSGRLFAAGSPVSASMYLDNSELLRGATYYTVEDGRFIVTVDGITYQMPLNELESYCRNNNGINAAKREALTDIMQEYDFYGTFAVEDVLDLSDDHDCECCAAEAETAAAYRTELPAATKGTGTAITPNYTQQQIINRATTVLNYEWTPCVSVKAYGGSVTFGANVTQKGIPYSRPGNFNEYKDEHDDIKFKQAYVCFDKPRGSNSVMTLSDFKSRVAKPGDDFKAAATDPIAKNYGPLYGLDCSRFVCYTWGCSGFGSGMYNNPQGGAPYCTQITSDKWFGQSTLNRILPGDALVMPPPSVNESGHAILVTAVNKDSKGNVVGIQTIEETPPKVVRTEYSSSSDFANVLKGILKNKKKATESNCYRIYRRNTTFTTLTLNPNGGSVNPKTIKISIGSKYGAFNSNKLPTPTRSGYGFLGWYTAASGGTLVNASTIVTNGSNHTLYAHWKKNGSASPNSRVSDALLPASGYNDERDQ